MVIFLKLAFIAIFSSMAADAAKLPAYITACKRDDPDLNACAKKNGQAAIGSIKNGDKDYKIPDLMPLKINHIGLEASKSLMIKVDNAEIFGLEHIIINDVWINLEDKKIRLSLYVPQLNIIGTYEINGKILILPIQGNGPCNITAVHANLTYSMAFELQKNKKGIEHAKIIHNKVNYVTERSYFHLQNLFNGDKVLGEQMALFLDENWHEVDRELEPAISETIAQIITTILTGIFDKVSYNHIFP